MKYSIFRSMLASLFIILFSYAGLSKLINYNLFFHQLSSFPFLPETLARFAWIIPVTEIIIVTLFFGGKVKITAYKLSVILLTLFTLYLLAVVLLAPHLPCSCGGIFEKLSWPQHIAFNILCIASGITGAYLEKKNQIFRSSSQNIVATSRDIRKPV